MTRFAVDAPIALRVVLEGKTAAPAHQLVGPGSLRSEVMALLYAQVRAGEAPEGDVGPLLEMLSSLKMRLLADRVSRSVTWRIATEHGLDDPRGAEVVAVAQLQADVLITDDGEVQRLAEGRVRTAGWSELEPALR